MRTLRHRLTAAALTAAPILYLVIETAGKRNP